MGIKRRAILILALSLCFPVLSFAENIHLKSGDIVEGTIVEETDKYVKIDFRGVPLTYYRNEIESIDKVATEEQVSALKKDDTDSKISIGNILAKSENIVSAQCEQICNSYLANDISRSIATISTKFWQKKTFAKIDKEIRSAGQITSVQKIIIRPEGVYIYNSHENKYMKSSEAYNSDLICESLRGVRQSDSLKYLGTETVDGKLATVIEYAFISNGRVFTRKVWIWNEKGLPLKEEFTLDTKGDICIIKLEYKDYNFQDIPDSFFDIPKDKIL